MTHYDFKQPSETSQPGCIATIVIMDKLRLKCACHNRCKINVNEIKHKFYTTDSLIINSSSLVSHSCVAKYTHT